MSKSLSESPSKSRILFFKNVLPALENARRSPPSRNQQIKLIQRFFSEIGRCTLTPQRLLPNLEALSSDVQVEAFIVAFIAAFIERMSVDEEFFNEYFNLITFKLGVGREDVVYIRDSIVGLKRQNFFIANGGVSGSNYIEDLLYDLLDAIAMNPDVVPTIFQYHDINECVDLLMCPLKVYFKLFIDFTRHRNPRITDEMAIKYFKIFMNKSELIILKKLGLINFVLMQEHNFKFDDDIINVLTSRFIMCLEFFKSTMRSGGFRGGFYNTVLQEFKLSHQFRSDALTALGILKGHLNNSIIILRVKERSEEENEQFALFLERDREVDRMIADLKKLIPLINALSDIFYRNSELASAATLQDTLEQRQQRQLQLQQLLQRQRQQHEGGRKKQKKCKNNKKCKNTKKSKNNKKCKNTKKCKR